MNAKKRKPLYGRLKQGLEESIAHVRNELTLRSVEIPDEPPQIDSATLAAVRQRAAMSQAVFARMLNVSTKTLQSWEQGSRRPSEAARRLIQVFCQQPEMLCRIVGLPTVRLPGVAIREVDRGTRKIVVTNEHRRKAL